MGVQYFHARWYHPALGAFLSRDPVDFVLNNVHSFNKYVYANANPYKYVDPDGRYGRGTGFTDEQWTNFDKHQKKAARRMLSRAASLEKKVAKMQKKGKAGHFELTEVAGYLRSGASALNSDGSDGHVANGVDSTTWVSMGQSPGAPAGVANRGPIMTVNTGHQVWGSGGHQIIGFILGHESLHSAGLGHQYGSSGATAYKHGNVIQRQAFKEISGTGKAATNPDHIMDMVY
ncbi:RHS repeat-associated core domain-containing protein [Gilvimarinus sp. F26214L]|uniref:RHS repeat-associated core domain-containing protein n=1 Tax=Gilvimarinus sp. DZF01 TaxID=3461371 RepID=UPI00404673FB